MKHPRYDLILAWAEGTIIQYRFNFNDNNPWEDFKPYPAPCPSFCMTYQYRIKPDPKKYRVYEYKVENSEARFLSMCQTVVQAQNIEKSTAFVRWVDNWVEYESEN